MSDPAAPTAPADATATVALMLPLMLLESIEVGVASGSGVKLLSACADNAAPEFSVQRKESLKSAKSL